VEHRKATPTRALTPVKKSIYRAEDIADTAVIERHFYRKTALFDRFMFFDIQVETSGTPRH
jgi:hypothetical protein